MTKTNVYGRTRRRKLLVDVKLAIYGIQTVCIHQLQKVRNIVEAERLALKTHKLVGRAKRHWRR